MAISTTYAEGTVALYDTTTGLAFGPVFSDSVEAEDFLYWISNQTAITGNTFKYGDAEIQFSDDLTSFGLGELIALVSLFKETWDS